MAEEKIINNEQRDAKEKKKELGEFYEKSFRELAEEEIVRGRVVEVGKEFVTIDVGYKSEGQVPLSEFYTRDGKLEVKRGDEVDVFLERREDEDQEGAIILSKNKADKMKIWDEIARACEQEDSMIEGTVVSLVRGGLTVDIGIPAFLPGSQIDLHPVHDLDQFIGQRLTFKVLKFNRKRGNIVLSRRSIMEQEREVLKKETLKNLCVDAVVDGVVKNITNYGAFVDLGGVDGLLHITDMAWGRVGHPAKRFTVGDRVTVKVIGFDEGSGRISLGLKQLTPDPWTTVAEKYPVGLRVRGTAVSITDYGVFVELEEGLEGLVHISEMSWTKKIKHPSKYVRIGDIVEAVVLNVDSEKKRISLGMKQVEPNPWDLIEDKYPVGTKIVGQVKTVTDFGIFIGIDEGIDGLVHVSELSWTKKIKRIADAYKKGEEVEAIVLKIDKENERFSLGIKQLRPDPWETVPQRYKAGQVVTGTITSLTDFGAFVELEEELEGLIHISELGTGEQKIGHPSDAVKAEDKVTVIILNVDPRERKIGLSIKALLRKKEREEIKQYVGGEEEVTSNLGEMIQDEMQKNRTEDKPEGENEGA
ncbi:MAG: 30S ribosomal protein S1 [Deltaproteobacteria bacterium]|nr:30S ribosomal protein S1 [Deltaproteobacteria bacterium]